VTIFVKDPGAAIDYAVDWSAGYLAGQTVAESAWTAAPAEAGGLAVEASAMLPGKTVVTLAGGIAGHLYRITNKVRFSDGRSDERTLVVRVEER
jgi:hypothetical protein